MKLSIGYITVPNKAEARKIAEALLAERLIACANIIDGVESYFEWKGDLCRENETVIFIKTRAKNEDKIIRFIREIHSYQCPCIIFHDIENGNPAFLKWIDKNC